MDAGFEKRPNFIKINELGGAPAMLGIVVDPKREPDVRCDALEFLVRHIDSDFGSEIKREVNRLCVEKLDPELREQLLEVKEQLEFFSGKTNDIDFLIEVATSKRFDSIRRVHAKEFLGAHENGPRKQDIARAKSLNELLVAEDNLSLASILNPDMARETVSKRSKLN